MKLKVTTVKIIIIYENKTEIFSGLYDSVGSSNFRVFEKDGKPYVGETNIIINGSEQPVDSLNVVSLVNIYCDDFDIRGNAAAMGFAVILLILWAIDICFPRALFLLSHFISVENPQPSQLYLSAQRIGWVAFPILSAIIMIISLL